MPHANRHVHPLHRPVGCVAHGTPCGLGTVPRDVSTGTGWPVRGRGTCVVQARDALVQPVPAVRPPRVELARRLLVPRDAGQAISRTWRLVDLVEGEGIPVRVYRTHRPGIVVYSDALQIAAVPRRDTFGRPGEN